jgi:hypothetical protein
MKSVQHREKNKTRQKTLQKETRSNYEECHERRRESNRTCKKKNRENMKKQLEEINQLNKQNERRVFYKAVNNMKRGVQPSMSGCKGKGGRMTGEERMILERWIEYFIEMLNEGKGDEESKGDYKRNLIAKLDQALEQPQETCKEPTRQEIGYAIQIMKNNRALGEDKIVKELIKYGGKE